jgi:hypothetical protein
MARKQHAFAFAGFAAIDSSLLEAPDLKPSDERSLDTEVSGARSPGVCCYVVPLHKRQCKDAPSDLLHDFDMRAHPTAGHDRSVTTVPLNSLLANSEKGGEEVGGYTIGKQTEGGKEPQDMQADGDGSGGAPSEGGSRSSGSCEGDP